MVWRTISIKASGVKTLGTFEPTKKTKKKQKKKGLGVVTRNNTLVNKSRNQLSLARKND